MNLTFGFIAFFIAVIIPGILFRRFFYYGEFSKQFDSKDPVLHSIFYSIVPGVCIQVICFILGDLIFSFGVDNTEIFNIFKDFVYSGEKEINEDTKDFLDKGLSTFIYYSLVVFLLSIIFGHLTSRFIRSLNWDKKYKIFKFKNQWFYIFSGELLKFEKFEFGRNITTTGTLPYNHKISTTYADVLVDNTHGMRELYTGYVVDYDLCTNDISQLERIYLLDTFRYKKKEKHKNLQNSNIEEITNENEQTVEELVDFKSRIRKKIPGDVFIVSGKDILNINLTYVPSDRKKQLQEKVKQSIYKKISNFYMVLSLCILLIHITYKFLGFQNTLFGFHMKNSNWVAIVFIYIVFLQILLIFTPSLVKDDQKYQYHKKEIFFRILTLIALYFIAVLMQYMNWLCLNFTLWTPF